MNKKKVLFINLLVFITLFIIIDFALGYFKIPYQYNHFRIKHPYYHHTMMKNTSQYTAWGGMIYPIKTNSLGFRDSANYKLPLKSNKKRILITGDSHTEGVGVEFEHTFAGILQKKVFPHNIEVLNSAAVSYSPKIHYLKTDYLLNKKGLECDEVWIFVDISDLQNEIAYEKFQPEAEGALFYFAQRIKKFFQKYSFTYYTIKSRQDAKRINAFVNKMKQFDERSIKNLEKNTVELYEDFFRDFDNDDLLRSPEFHGVGNWYYDSANIQLANKGLELGQKNIKKLASICKDKNIKMRLSVHPWQSQVLEQDTADYYVKSWRKFCQQNNIEFINLFPLFINNENPFIVNQKYYIPNDNHWNEAGHEKVANYLFTLIKN